jgi:hypothetical protein
MKFPIKVLLVIKGEKKTRNYKDKDSLPFQRWIFHMIQPFRGDCLRNFAAMTSTTYSSRAAVNTRNYLHFTRSCQYQELLTLHAQLSIPGITYTSRAAVNTRNYLHFTSSCHYQELLTLHEQLLIPGITYTSRAAVATLDTRYRMKTAK